MTKISVYNIDEYVTADDKWIGTDVNTYNKTKNFTPRKLSHYFNNNQVINTGVDLLYKYFTITPPETRPTGTLSFETEIGPTVNFSAISTFLLSNTTLKGNYIVEFFDFLVGKDVLLYKAKNINLFGSYKILSVEEYLPEPNFFVVNVEFVEGNGFIEEDEYYMISLIGSPEEQSLQDVTDIGSTTTNDITANSFIKQGGTGTNILLDDGDTIALSSIGGNTNLSTSQTASNFTINSDTGTDASVPLGDGTLAGATLNNYTTTEKNKLAAITGTNTGDQNLQSVTDLGDTTTNDITAASFVKSGGFDFQFLKADGSVDNNTYLTSADLPSTLDLYATTSPDPVIAGYTALVRNIADTRYNTTAVNVPTPTITGTLASPTFCGAVISDPSILLGNPGVFNFSVIGKIRRTGGSTSSGADFFFSIYKRDIAGVETKIADSAPVVVPANGGVYTEYISIALWNNGIFLSTDRVVLKFYGIKSGGGSGATYEFLFGGADPVRGTAAISSAIIPNLYLRDLADVEKTDALNNEVLYWNDADSLWEHSLVVDLTPDASATQKGLVTTGTQTFAGVKTFSSSPIAPTPSNTTNNTTVATTAFVQNNIADLDYLLVTSFRTLYNY
jgi:hypothetical protein